ncbi:hypothetical protein Dda_6255 [Drechslerella dactyloides]|uniref:Defective in cullin neddylation protein n=1 Tax=Drechslerella dactyloides TaxID=74499 RepID=A0AAD6IV96_DREDA|nr:hypothetical protein Dda_6255 [Drechslerella dactyloides]
MPPKKRTSSSAATADVPPPAPRRSTRSASSLGRSNSSNVPAADSLKTPPTSSSSSSTSASAPNPTAVSTASTSDMGSAVSKAKALKAKRSRKAHGEAPGSDVSSRIEELTVDEGAGGGSVKGKRKSATGAEAKANGVKKARLSKDSINQEEEVPVPAATSKTKTAAAKKAPKTVDEWYTAYASEDDPEQIDVGGIIKLLGDLDVKFESAAIYILCWKLELEAMGSIPKKKWVDGMNKHSIKNNQQLLKTLAAWLQDTKPVSPPSDSFLAFYKYMFQFSKATPETRSVALESALAVLTFVLDPLTYDLKYDPATAVTLKADVHPYPHAAPFLEFLTQKQPVKVINKDQWESFIPFNRSVSYSLENYNPEGAWPNLYDQYVDWRKEAEKADVGPKDGPDTES